LSHPASIGSQRRSWGRSALGLFAAVWLNLALQPCAMALTQEDDHDCPNCPPAEMQGHHDMHADMHAGMDAQMPCADGLSDCSLDGEFSHDTRFGTSKFKSGQADWPATIAITELVTPSLVPLRERPPPPFATTYPGTPPPLHVLYCVYLD